MAIERDSFGWLVEQYKSLRDERKEFDKYMWQFPVASLGVVAILLNSIRTLSVVNSSKSLITALIMFMGSGICIYAAFMLGRLRVRRKVRESRIDQIESQLGSISTTVIGTHVDDYAKSSNKTDQIFGRIRTTRLGISVLILVAILLFISSILILFVHSDAAQSDLGGLQTSCILCLSGLKKKQKSQLFSLPNKG